MPLQFDFKVPKQTSSSQNAVSITPLVVPHVSLPCDKKGGDQKWMEFLGVLLLGFLPIDNLHVGRAIVVVFPMTQWPTSRTWKFLFELTELGLAVFR